MNTRLPMQNYLSKFLLPVLFFSSLLFSQPFQRLVSPFPVSDSLGSLQFPFSGGFNNIKTQFVDINGDGFKDIIYVSGDGTSGRLDNTGSSGNPSFTVNPQKLPGAVIKDWFYLVDLDNDGDYDMATGGAESYVRLYRNTGNVSFPSYSLWADTLKDNLGQPIIVENTSNHTFCDIDNDGDKDFFAGSSLGSITFYSNIGTPQNPVFSFITSSWQNILIVSGGKKELEKQGIKLHGANAIDFGDLDGDGDYDLLWGDFFSNSMYYIENRGSATVPDMRVVATGFPRNADSIMTSGFNMPRLADIDNDGDLDLFVSVLYDPAAPQKLMFYKNYGTAFSPDIRFVTDDFLHTFDAGTQSSPVAVDINNDGKPDIISGSSRTPSGTLHLLLNTGTAAAYSFLYTDSHYGGVASELAVAPAIADADGDGLKDIFAGTYYGTILFYKNSGTASAPVFTALGEVKDVTGQAIDIGLFARPFLTDIDSDGDIDLVCGGYNGRVVLYRNTGTVQQLSFTREDSYFGSIDAGDLSAPVLSMYGTDSLPQLFIGNREGYIQRYVNTGSRQVPVWNLAEPRFQNISAGTEATPFFYDFDNDGDNDLIIGCNAGGLYFYKNNSILNSTADPVSAGSTVNAWCYISEGKLMVNASFDISSVTLYSISGEEIMSEQCSGRSFVKALPGKWSAGVYFAVIRGKEHTEVCKIKISGVNTHNKR